MNQGILWLIIFVALVVIEAITVNFVSIWFAIGALFAYFASVLGYSFMTSLTVGVLSSVILLFSTRSFVKNVLKSGSVKMNATSVIGKTALVTEAISGDDYGQVKIDGNIWTAKANTEKEIPAGTHVVVLAIEGVKVIVSTK